MLTVIIYLTVVILVYFAIGYITALVFTLRHKSGGKVTRNFMPQDTTDKYNDIIYFWPLLLFILACFAMDSTVEKTKAFISQVNLSPVAPESIADRIINHNKMLVIEEGKESQDG